MVRDEPRAGLLRVPGGTLHYKIRGAGPLLLMLQGGDGDADGTDALAEYLADQYTIVSYDRRGLSRSPLDNPHATVDLVTHSDDAARLLTAVTGAPALVFGGSLGALLGLDLVSRHPRLVRLLVAHEPPATELLPPRERQQAVADQEEIEQLYRTGGVAAAMQRFVAVAGADVNDREPDVALPRPRPERIANLEFFLTYDAPAVRRYRLDRAGLRAAANRIVPAAGHTSATGFAHLCARALAEELGRPLAEFPGGHSGFVLRPRAFATRLREVLDDATRPEPRTPPPSTPAQKADPDTSPSARPATRP
jgi:pimeloyl-ACP methyl ester carboxylesterase